MKTVSIWIALILTMAFIPCNAQNTGKQGVPSIKTNGSATSTEKVEAYYFHLTSRCPTCIAVESVAKKTIESLYAGKVTFKSINLDDASSKTIAEKLKVPGQALLIVKGGKQVNLTNEGFMYAKMNPEKFKSIIKENVDALLL